LPDALEAASSSAPAIYDMAILNLSYLYEFRFLLCRSFDLRDEEAVSIKQKKLGENIARLYGIDIPAQTAKLNTDGLTAGQ
jgi:hypothetical protein